uniref:Centrosomal protein of 70 kDa n=1 Tax=Leptobrachium leishanense TaxID=445787 RepID=A0A8C5WCU2_9ANUR
KASELQQILDGVRTKIRDLEDDFINKTRRQKPVTIMFVQDLCQELRDKLRQQDETLSQLRTRLSESAAEERPAHHGKTFLRLMKRPQSVTGENGGVSSAGATCRYCIPGRLRVLVAPGGGDAELYLKMLWLLPLTPQCLPQEACAQLHVQHVTDLAPAISSHAKLRQVRTRESQEVLFALSVSHRLFLFQILSEIRSVLGGPRAPQLLYKHSIRPQEPRNADSEDEAAFLHLLPTIELWAGQLVSLKTLHRALRKLNEKLLPNLEETCESGDVPRVEELLLLVDTMLEDVDTRDPACVSAHTLRALVAHFQKLFDVPSVSGVYPRMNEVYSKLGETCNMMRNLQCVLGLDGKVTCGALVNAVWQLCRELEEGESQKLRGVLGTLDIDSVINKIQEHEEFFPAFEGLITELLDVLGKYRALGARSCRAAQLPVRLSFINLVLSLQKSGGWSRSCRQCGG